MNLGSAARCDAVVEASLYQRPHDRYAGKFAIWRNHGSGGLRRQMRQEMFDVSDLVEVLTSLDSQWDTYISQGTFRSGKRWVTNLGRICLHFVDLDTYRVPGLAGKSPEQLTRMLLRFCADEGLPEPTIIMSSGRGMYVKWVSAGVLPQDVLPRWNEVQDTLVAAFASFGADAAAKDAARLMRLVESVNSKSRDVAYVTHFATGEDGQPLRYAWDDFCDTVLPVQRRVLERRRKAHGPVQLVLIPGVQDLSEQARNSWRRVNWRRWKDLDTLVDLRGGVDEGQRMHMLMWQTNFLLASGATNPQQMWGEVANVASRIDPDWHYRKAELGTLYRKAKAQLRGEYVIYQGKTWTPLYTPRTQTLINLFQITEDEQQHLTTLISQQRKQANKRAADRERITEKRRNEGALERARYLAQVTKDDLRTEVKRLHEQGLSLRKIGSQVGVSHVRVSKLLEGC